MTDIYRPLKDAFGRFATGITVVSCKREDGSVIAITVNSFTSVSLEPALVLWCLEKKASTYQAFMSSPAYAISVLRADQQSLSNRFAGHSPAPLTSAEVDVAVSGAPLLRGRLAGFDCTIVDRHEAGDHVILIGQVDHFDSAEGDPLVYHASRYFSGCGE